MRVFNDIELIQVAFYLIAKPYIAIRAICVSQKQYLLVRAQKMPFKLLFNESFYFTWNFKLNSKKQLLAKNIIFSNLRRLGGAIAAGRSGSARRALRAKRRLQMRGTDSPARQPAPRPGGSSALPFGQSVRFWMHCLGGFYCSPCIKFTTSLVRCTCTPSLSVSMNEGFADPICFFPWVNNWLPNWFSKLKSILITDYHNRLINLILIICPSFLTCTRDPHLVYPHKRGLKIVVCELGIKEHN